MMEPIYGADVAGLPSTGGGVTSWERPGGTSKGRGEKRRGGRRRDKRIKNGGDACIKGKKT